MARFKNVKEWVKRNRILVLSAVVALLVIYLFLFALSLNNPASQSVQEQQSPVQQQSAVSPTISSPSQSYHSTTGWYALKTQLYNAPIPSDWKPSTSTFNGGSSVVIRPSEQLTGDPLLVIESYYSSTNLKEKEQVFLATGLTKTTIFVQGRQASKLTGRWGTRTIDGKTISTPTQERVVFLPTEKYFFAIKLYYSSSQPIQAYDTLFDQIVTNFRVQK